MLTLININIVVLVLDQIHAHNIHCQINGVKDAVIFCVDNNLSVDTDNGQDDALVLDEGPTYVLDDTTITAETIYSVEVYKKNLPCSAANIFCVCQWSEDISIQNTILINFKTIHSSLVLRTTMKAVILQRIHSAE